MWKRPMNMAALFIFIGPVCWNGYILSSYDPYHQPKECFSLEMYPRRFITEPPIFNSSHDLRNFVDSLLLWSSFQCPCSSTKLCIRFYGHWIFKSEIMDFKLDGVRWDNDILRKHSSVSIHVYFWTVHSQLVTTICLVYLLMILWRLH